MHRIRAKREMVPKDWEVIESTMEDFDRKMREAQSEPHEGKRRVESLWPIFRIHHQRSRYLFEMYYKKKEISKDAALIAKWKKPGFENLCCLRCIQTRDTNFGTNCICRVPKSKLDEARIIECVHCGCRGCSG